MSLFYGLDIGGTKIAGAAYTEAGEECASFRLETPKVYEPFLESCVAVLEELEKQTGATGPVGIGAPGCLDEAMGVFYSANTPMDKKPLRADLEARLQKKIRLANDANCLALAEYLDGAGRGAKSLFGVILGTGVGGGFIFEGKIVSGRNGFAGEFAQLPLPFREPEDSPLVPSYCGQSDCIEGAICAAGLERLTLAMTGKETNTYALSNAAAEGDPEATRVLQRYYEIVGKAFLTPLYCFDPEVITISGGLNGLPGLYEAVPVFLEKYALTETIKTKIVRAHFDKKSGVRGAASLWRSIGPCERS